MAVYGDQAFPSCSSNFELIILRKSWFELGLGYDAEPARTTLKSADTHDSLFLVNTGFIEEYDWNVQKITLTQQGTGHLIRVLGRVKGLEPNEFTKPQNLKESFGWGNPVARALHLHAFLIRVGNQVKYGGIFLDVISAMAINFPVIRVTISDGKAVMVLLPIHIPFAMIDSIDERGNTRKSVIIEEAKRDARQLGSFSEWPTELATSETAIKFRAIIRNDAIKCFFKTAGKYRE